MRSTKDALAAMRNEHGLPREHQAETRGEWRAGLGGFTRATREEKMRTMPKVPASGEASHAELDGRSRRCACTGWLSAGGCWACL